MFITLEGPEGSGKSTLLQSLGQRLRAEGHDFLLTREPGSGAFGAGVRKLLLEGESMQPLTELFLFLADRSEHVAQEIEPALKAGRSVLCDRFADSTIVYQGYGRMLDLDLVRNLNRLAVRGVWPDMTILLDIDPRVGLSRRDTVDRLDAEPIEFHDRVRVGFLEEAKREPERWRFIDATQPAERVLQAAWEILSGCAR